MRKTIFLFFLIFAYHTIISTTGKTVLLTRPLYYSPLLKQSRLNFDTEINNQCNATSPILQFVLLYQKTVCRQSIEKIIYPCITQNSLIIRGDQSLITIPRDIRAEWLMLPPTFFGTLSLHPGQKQTCIAVNYTHPLSALFDWQWFNNMFLFITVPLQITKNRLSPMVNNNQNIMNNSSLMFAKFFYHTKQEIRIAELEIGIETEWSKTKDFLLRYITSFSIPTGNKFDPEFLFAPIAGNNKHLSFNAFVDFEIPLYQTHDVCLTLYAGAENRYLFHNYQRRTFDLKNKPWSRYLLFRKGELDIQGNLVGTSFIIPASSILTQRTKVYPFSWTNVFGSFKIKKDNINVEFGYQLWAKSRECLFIQKNCHTLKNFTSYAIAGTGTSSASNSTIQYQAPNDTTFTPLKLSDINVCSAAYPSVLSQGFVINCSYQKNDFMLKVGFFKEYAHHHSAFRQHQIWGSFNIAF